MSSTNKLSASAIPPLPQTAPASAAKKHTYGQILKSSALIGGSSGLNVVIGMVRNKAMTVLLGAEGFGVLGLLGSVADLVQSVVGMGVSNSSVRQIAEAAGAGDNARIARTVTALKRTSLLLGLIGVVLVMVFCRQISYATFQTDKYAVPVALLSIAVFLRVISLGQSALIQGMRRISDLAKIGVFGALFGTVISIPIVYYFREQGIVPSLIAVAGSALVASWWYARKVQIPASAATVSEVRTESVALLKLGFAFMASGLMIMGVSYAVRIIVARKVGLEAAGLYHAAWGIGGLYVAVILQSMGADFYPRLTAVARDNSECNRVVNEQTRISLLLAGPGVIGTLTFASIILAVFCTKEFSAGAGLLRWICLGMTLRVITWPMGYIILAKAEQKIFFWTEVAWTAVHIGLAYALIPTFGVNGAGMAFFGSYVFHGFLIYPIVHRLTGFRWSAANLKTGLLFLGTIAAVFAGFHVLPSWAAIGFGTLAGLLSGIYSVRVLIRLVPHERIPVSIRRILVRIGLARFDDAPVP